MSRFASIASITSGLSSIIVTPEENYSGATMTFVQAAAPPGWTKVTASYAANVGMRVVSGTPTTNAGSTTWGSAWASRNVGGSLTVSGTTGATTLTSSNLPTHSHTAPVGATTSGTAYGSTIPTAAPAPVYTYGYYSTTYVGPVSWGGGAHTHPVPSQSVSNTASWNFAVKYVDVILATKG